MDNKLKCFCLLAIMLAIIGIEYPIDDDTFNVWNLEVNNTDLATPRAGHTPNGTGERALNTTYWANETPIQVMIYAHASTSSSTAQINFTINGTLVEITSGRPLGAAETSYKAITAIVPRYANYSASISNFHHYEWREYKVITGANGTLGTIPTHNNLSGLQGGNAGADEFYHLNFSHWNLVESGAICTSSNPDNYTFVTIGAGLQFYCITDVPRHDPEKVNKSGDNLTGSLDFGKHILTNVSEINFYSFNYTNNLEGRYSAISYPYIQSGTSPPTLNFYFRTVSRIWNTSINDFSNASNPEQPGSYDSLGNGNYQVGSFPPNSTTKHLDFEVSSGDSPSAVKNMVKIYTPLNLTVSALAGVGNAYVCVDSTGKLYRGSPGC